VQSESRSQEGFGLGNFLHGLDSVPNLSLCELVLVAKCSIAFFSSLPCSLSQATTDEERKGGKIREEREFFLKEEEEDDNGVKWKRRLSYFLSSPFLKLILAVGGVGKSLLIRRSPLSHPHPAMRIYNFFLLSFSGSYAFYVFERKVLYTVQAEEVFRIQCIWGAGSISTKKTQKNPSSSFLFFFGWECPHSVPSSTFSSKERRTKTFIQPNSFLMLRSLSSEKLSLRNEGRIFQW